MDHHQRWSAGVFTNELVVDLAAIWSHQCGHLLPPLVPVAGIVYLIAIAEPVGQ